jgi:Fe2+ transport system protein FeoA
LPLCDVLNCRAAVLNDNTMIVNTCIIWFVSSMAIWKISNKQSANIKPNIMSVSFERLHEIGFVAGQAIWCLYRNPLKGPLVLQANNYEFSLKQSIANRINISVA